jgi:hypothetical protein
LLLGFRSRKICAVVGASREAKSRRSFRKFLSRITLDIDAIDVRYAATSENVPARQREKFFLLQNNIRKSIGQKSAIYVEGAQELMRAVPPTTR